MRQILPSQSSIEAFYTATLYIYIYIYIYIYRERERERERERREISPPQSIEHRSLAYCYTAYIYVMVPYRGWNRYTR